MTNLSLWAKMFFNADVVANQKTMINNLQTLVDEQQKTLDELNAKLKQLEEIEPFDVMIDFSKINAFSIERFSLTDTVIGYFDSKGDAQEWRLTCPVRVHNKLIQQYNLA